MICKKLWSSRRIERKSEQLVRRGRGTEYRREKSTFLTAQRERAQGARARFSQSELGECTLLIRERETISLEETTTRYR
jgi:hypothetical protein